MCESGCCLFSSFPPVKNPVVITRSANRGIWARVPKSCQRRMAQWLGRRPCRIQMESPVISFTFDDFPRSALLNAGAILRERSLAGTYYASFGLIGKKAPTGEIFTREDLDELIRQEHELGCHTYDHYDSWDTVPLEFEASILRNQRAVGERLPGTRLRSLSYPISYPRPRTKRCTEKYFSCARGGGQTFNTGIVDLNYLKAFFIEQSGDNFDAIKQTIDGNACAKGWLIFATHDVCDQPTRFGCAPGFFEKVVDYAIQSKATILPVFRAWQVIFGTTDERSPNASSIRRTIKLDIPRFAKGGPAAS
jgi:peptidoglycan/xylan/chitin deacetylase (PgdA/CDA1 family)